MSNNGPIIPFRPGILEQLAPQPQYLQFTNQPPQITVPARRPLVKQGPTIINRFMGGRKERLLHAIQEGNLKLINELIARGADVNTIVDPVDGNTPLALACESGRSDIVRVLIAAGADVNATSSDGTTALMMASTFGSLETVNDLIAAGANVNAALYYGSTALISACRMGRIDVARVLIANGADVNVAPRNDGMTSLMIASQANNMELVQLLCQSGATTNNVNFRGYKAIDFTENVAIQNYLRQGCGNVLQPAILEDEGPIIPFRTLERGGRRRKSRHRRAHRSSSRKHVKRSKRKTRR